MIVAAIAIPNLVRAKPRTSLPLSDRSQLLLGEGHQSSPPVTRDYATRVAGLGGAGSAAAAPGLQIDYSILMEAVMQLFQFDPVKNKRWPELLEKHPRACVFHTPGWLEALRNTYGYDPIGYTASPPGDKIRSGFSFLPGEELADGTPPGIVNVVSDHCEPLLDSDEVDFLCRVWKLRSERGIGITLRFVLSVEVSIQMEKGLVSGPPRVIGYTALTCAT